MDDVIDQNESDAGTNTPGKVEITRCAYADEVHRPTNRFRAAAKHTIRREPAIIRRRSIVLAGIAGLAASTVLIALAREPWQLYLAFALMSLGWTGMGTVAIAALVSAWFDRRRGLAISLALTGASCGGVVVVPLLVLLVEAIGFALPYGAKSGWEAYGQ